MPKLYRVEINRLPLPRGPLSEGHPERTVRISGKPAEFSSEADALRHARNLINQGCDISIVCPDGREIAHEEILRRLNA